MFPYRLINPVVVAPTIAAVGLSFYSYGFPLVGTCIEIGAVQILVAIVFSLVSLFNWPWVFFLLIWIHSFILYLKNHGVCIVLFGALN